MKKDKYPIAGGEITISIIGHGAFYMEHNGKIIHVDPYSEAGYYSSVPKADLVLITHDHYDHYDKEALSKVMKPDTLIITSPTVAKQEKNAIALRNGEKTIWNLMAITAVAAYNIVNMREPGQPYHPKGAGNGYILETGGLRIYIAGDTELIPEMDHVGEIDIAFLPKNLPYTMSDQMFIEAARTVQPKVLYPYHYFEIDWEKLKEALPSIDIR